MPEENPLVEVGQDSRGNRVYRKGNEAGGDTYYSDDIGGGRVVLDTALDEPEAIVIAMKDAGWLDWLKRELVKHDV